MAKRNERKRGNPRRNSRYQTSLRSKYGLSRDEYARLLEFQDGRCAICREPETAMIRGQVLRLSVDHHHTTGVVRGLLCRNCNWAIGRVRERPDVLEAAAAYLRG